MAMEVIGRSTQQMMIVRAHCSSNIGSNDSGVRNSILLQKTVVEGVYFYVRFYVKHTTRFQPFR